MKASVIVVTLLLAIGCGSDPKPPAKAPVETQPPPVASAPVEPEKPGDDPSRSNINISDEIKRACGISDHEAYFAFDSARVRPQDEIVLKKLATCFSTGPLKGRLMRLVGHADPRGEAEYNMVLGGRRADNIKAAIVDQGLAAKQISTTSRGELDASGTDEASWAKDRRVDVVLGN